MPSTETGADASFAATYRRLGAALYRQALALTGDAAAAEDAVQEAFVRVWRRRERVADLDALDGYLALAVRRLALDHLRRRGRAEDPLEDPGGLVAAREDDDPADAERIDRALADLPPEQREVVVLRVYQGLTFPEVAARTDAALGTVHSRFRYAMQRLRGLLETSS